MDAPSDVIVTHSSVETLAPGERFCADVTAMVHRCCPDARTVTALSSPFRTEVEFMGRIQDYTALAELLSRTHHCLRSITITADFMKGRVTNSGSDAMPDEWKSPDSGAAFRAFLDGLSPEEIQAYRERFAPADDAVGMPDDIKDDLRFQ